MKIFPRRLLRRFFAAGRRRSKRTERGELFFAAFAQKTGADAGARPVLLGRALWILCRGLGAARRRQVYTIGLVEPLTAALLGIALLGERMAGGQASGMACQFLCMALTGWDVMRRPRTEDAAARRRVNAKNGGDR